MRFEFVPGSGANPLFVEKSSGSFHFVKDDILIKNSAPFLKGALWIFVTAEPFV